MPDTQDAKRMARSLREALAATSITISHSQSLELVAQTLGHADWNTFSAAASKSPEPPDGSRFDDVIPIFRIFDLEKANAFYVDLLGFRIDWQHRFEEGYPLYMQVSRGGLRLHLSEHHGDATPGSSAHLPSRARRAACRADGQRKPCSDRSGPQPHDARAGAMGPFRQSAEICRDQRSRVVCSA